MTLCCLLFFDLRILITSLVSSWYCVVCPSSIYGFRLPLWYLHDIVLSVILRFTDSDYLFGIFMTLCCLLFFDLRILITSLVSSWYCVVCYSSIYGFWLPLWYLQTLLMSGTTYILRYILLMTGTHDIVWSIFAFLSHFTNAGYARHFLLHFGNNEHAWYCMFHFINDVHAWYCRFLFFT
jgi:hypothetical protein